MGQIRLLPKEVIQRIAAGEVVDRPSSVVKELIENSIDAGASHIRIEIEADGLAMIRVVDDGAGIAASAIELAFARHATSKLARLDDIPSIATLGFRGEALASIAAVAEVTLETMTSDDKIGTSALVRAGGPIECSPIVRHPGTSVLVRDLFVDLPARREIARSSQSERRELLRVVRQYAFATPHVSFLLRLDGHDMLNTAASNESYKILTAVYGPGAERLLAHIESSEAALSGFVSTSSLSRPTREHIYLSVNGRPIANRALLDGVESGYRTYFPRGRHPIASIRIELPPTQIDPNIHPAKREIRLFDEQTLRINIAEAVHSALEAAVSRPNERPDLSPAKLLVSNKNSGATAQLSLAAGNERLPLKAIASSSRGLLLAEGPNGLYLVDQHRAHERLIYNRFRIQHGWDNVVREPLVEPIVLELPPSQAQRLSSRIGELVEAGFECEQFGGRSFIVRTAPDQLLPEAIADSLSESLTADDETWLDRLLIGLSCRSAVRKGALLPSVEQEALIDGLCATESPTACPHGSPIMLHLDDAFLRRQFGW